MKTKWYLTTTDWKRYHTVLVRIAAFWMLVIVVTRLLHLRPFTIDKLANSTQVVLSVLGGILLAAGLFFLVRFCILILMLVLLMQLVSAAFAGFFVFNAECFSWLQLVRFSVQVFVLPAAYLLLLTRPLYRSFFARSSQTTMLAEASSVMADQHYDIALADNKSFLERVNAGCVVFSIVALYLMTAACGVVEVIGVIGLGLGRGPFPVKFLAVMTIGPALLLVLSLIAIRVEPSRWIKALAAPLVLLNTVLILLGLFVYILSVKYR